MLLIWVLGLVVASGGYAYGWLDPLATAVAATVVITVGAEVRHITERAPS